MSSSLGRACGLLLSAVFAGALHAQPAGITPEMIATALPEEGAPKAVPGPYAVMVEPAAGNAGLRVVRPADLAAFPARDTLPVLVWGNGGCAMDNPRYNGFLSTIASHGFLVVTTANATPPAEGAPRRQATAEHLRQGIEWAQAENTRAGSPLRGKVETRKVAVMGQSCGGGLSLALGLDPRVATIGVFNSGAQEAGAPGANPAFPTFDQLAKLHGPVLLIDGHERDFMHGRALQTYEAIQHVPVFHGARRGAGHTATAYHAGGGEFANVASAWLRWQFKGDAASRAMFVGQKCGLCTNRDWEALGKRLE